MSVEVLSSPEHPVKAGLSDAFMVLEPSPLPAGQQQEGSVTLSPSIDVQVEVTLTSISQKVF